MRSFRMHRAESVPFRLHVIWYAAFSVYIVAGILVLALLFVIGSNVVFFDGDQPDWQTIFAFAALGTLSILAVQVLVFRGARSIATHFLTDKYMTLEQAAAFPGLYEPWPDCWCRPGETSHKDG